MPDILCCSVGIMIKRNFIFKQLFVKIRSTRQHFLIMDVLWFDGSRYRFSTKTCQPPLTFIIVRVTLKHVQTCSAELSLQPRQTRQSYPITRCSLVSEPVNVCWLRVALKAILTRFPACPDEVLGDAEAAGRALDAALRAAPAAPLLLYNRAALLASGPRPLDPAQLDRAEALYERVRRRARAQREKNMGCVRAMSAGRDKGRGGEL